MKVYVHSDSSDRSIFASSFNRAIEHMNKYPCAFITAFRDEDENGRKYTRNEKRKMNKQLEADIKASGLSFIRAVGGFIEDIGTSSEKCVDELSFCVIDNRFPPKNFIKLMVHLCKKYNQDAVLVTEPVPEKVTKSGHAAYDSPINIVGKYYDGDGNVVDVFEHADIQDVEYYFTRICGKNFVLSSTDEVITKGFQIYCVSGRCAAMSDFKKMYPDLL